jgi:hypothetical protein
MKNSVFYFLYIIFLLIFFWRTALFWYDDRTIGETGKDYILYIALVMVELLSVSLILFANKKKRHDSWIHGLCVGWEIIALACLVFNNASIGHYPKVLAWPLFFESAYLIVRWDFRMIKSLRNVSYWFLLIGGYVFYKSLLIRQFERQSNLIYFLMLPVPIILLHCSPKWRLRILLLTSFFALVSMKRSMILAIILFWAIYIFKILFSKGKKSMAIVFSVILLGVAYGIVNVVDEITDGGLSARTVDYEKEDISNGREAIYEITWGMIVNSSKVHLILGHGHNAVFRDSPLEISAHNDFMEIIYDYGIIALVVYLGLWLYVVKQFLFHYRNNTIYFMPYALSICIFAVMAMVSQLVLYVSYFLYLVMFWGIVQAAKEEVVNKEVNNKLK